MADADDQSCVSRLHRIKVSLQEVQGSNTAPLAPGCSGIDVSWGECAVHLLTQLTLAHEDETWTVLHSLQDLVNLKNIHLCLCSCIWQLHLCIFICLFPLGFKPPNELQEYFIHYKSNLLIKVTYSKLV